VDRRADLAVAAAVTAIGVVFLVASLTAPPPRVTFDVVGPYGFALWVSIALVTGGAALVIRDVVALRRGITTIDDDVSDDEPGQPASAWRAASIVAASFGYMLALPWLGYVIASLAFVVVAMLLLAERSKALIALAAMNYTAVTFYLFAIVLRVPLPLGPLNDLFVSLGIVDRVR
jgi:putative tricarboxylic transport membrane protein